MLDDSTFGLQSRCPLDPLPPIYRTSLVRFPRSYFDDNEKWCSINGNLFVRLMEKTFLVCASLETQLRRRRKVGVNEEWSEEEARIFLEPFNHILFWWTFCQRRNVSWSSKPPVKVGVKSCVLISLPSDSIRARKEISSICFRCFNAAAAPQPPCSSKLEQIK